MINQQGLKMYIEQIYTGCLAEAAYYIESEGEAVIIDPLREIDPYIEKANQRGTKIKYVLETHFHADFVSGHIDLANKTGAAIVYGPTAKTSFDAHIAEDGEVLKLGNASIEIMHTPGHTMESTVFLLKDETGKNHSIFTGDTLFIGDVGRPDLAVKSDLTKEDLAGYLFDSLRNRIMPLEDDVMVYPAHGAGSACGKNMSSETFSTLGEQKRTNYALQEMTREEFIKEVTEGIAPPPQYFPKNAMLNKMGYQSVEEVIKKGMNALDVSTVKQYLEEGKLVLDVRSVAEFAAKHIPNSVFIGLDGNFATWVGALIEDLTQPIVLIVDEDRVEEAVTRLARVGYDNTIGYLKGGISSWEKEGNETYSIAQIAPSKLTTLGADKNILDVRKPTEYTNTHIDGASNFPLDYINSNLEKLDSSQQYYVHCKAGYRSLVAISILKKNGFDQLIDIEGGFDAIETTNIPLIGEGCSA